MDAAETTTEPTAEAAEQPQDEQGLGDAGKKALNAERDARKSAEARVKDLEQQLADAVASSDTSKADAAKALADAQAEVERLNQQVQRLEVIREKGLSDALGAFIQGGTREELEASADQLLAALPTPKEPEPPRPSPYVGGGDMPLNGDDLADALRAAIGAN